MINKYKCLDLFCGDGLAGFGYQSAGFAITGIDKKKIKNYPGQFIQTDAIAYLKANYMHYDFLHCSPPCQSHSKLKGMVKHDYPDYVPFLLEFLPFTGKPFIIENVPGCPFPSSIRLDGTMFNLKVIKRRIFYSNILLFQPQINRVKGLLGGVKYGTNNNGYMSVVGNCFNKREAINAMGVKHKVSLRGLAEGIPPAYTNFLGTQVINYLSLNC